MISEYLFIFNTKKSNMQLRDPPVHKYDMGKWRCMPIPVGIHESSIFIPHVPLVFPSP